MIEQDWAMLKGCRKVKENCDGIGSGATTVSLDQG